MIFLRLFRGGLFCFLILNAQLYLYSQQLSLQNTSETDSTDTNSNSVTDLSTPSYLEMISRSEHNSDQRFRPTSSDLVIQQAERKFQQGRALYAVKDIDRARIEFDAAIDLMLQASDNPSDRPLYEAKMDDMVDSIHRLDLAGLGAAAPSSDKPQYEKVPLEDILQMTFPVDPKLKHKVQGELTATASQLPLIMNDTVLGYINYFSGRGHNTIVAGLQRAGKYRAMIQRILAEEGVPQELIHLAQAESGFLPRALSNKAAAGMWQFVKFRGQEYGLSQTAYTDDRLDPEKATRAAARHLRDLYKEFGNWYLAIAAYNCGPGNIEKAVERTGYADFWELRARHAIPTETTNYVPIILAMTIMTKNAAEYGLTEVVPEASLEYDTVNVTAPTHLALIGDLTDTPVSQLTAMNPALLRNIAPEGYSLRVPKGAGENLLVALDRVPAMQRASWRIHRVEAGDTLASIAHRYSSAASRIADANQLNNNDLVAGATLLIPTSTRTDAARATTSGRRATQSKSVQRPSLHHSSSAALLAKSR